MTKCQQEGCETRSIYGIKGGKAIYCKSHKTPKMVDV
jgi:hypothetical protein